MVCQRHSPLFCLEVTEDHPQILHQRLFDTLLFDLHKLGGYRLQAASQSVEVFLVKTNTNSTSVGFCIYCGASPGKLSDEHIVPFAFGGTAVLTMSSCTGCAKTTSQFEQFCARTILGPYRVKTGAPTRRPNQRPKKLALGLLDHNGVNRKVEIPADEHPGTLILPVFAEPRLLTLSTDKRRESFIIWLALQNLDILSLSKRYDASAIQLGSFEILNFCRLLAKIAHGAAYYLLPGWTEKFEPLLVELILGKSREHDLLVGGNDRVENAAQDMGFPLCFESADVGGERYLIAEFRLFALEATPIYRVVVGKKRKFA
jgi:hypothetical protein